MNTPPTDHVICGDMSHEIKKYHVIYADPPWKYDFSASEKRGIENHYPTMTVDEIKDIKVPLYDDAVCYLWATAPKLIEALEVLVAWGFKYKTNAVWDKKIIGMGYWFRGQHEILLVGTRGSVSPPPQSERISSIISQKRGAHSKKPDSIRVYLSKCYPTENKIELFARERVEGWDVWGNEMPSTTQRAIT